MLSKSVLFFFGIAFMIIGFTNGDDANPNEIDGSEKISPAEWRRARDRIEEAISLESWKTYKEWHNVSLDLQIYYNDHPMFQKYIEFINQDCVNEKLKIENYGENKMNFSDALRIYAPANILCMEKNGNKIISLITADVLERISKRENQLFNQYSDCFMKKLKEIDQNSKFLENFVENTIIHTDEECEDALNEDEIEQKVMASILRITGDFVTATCGHFNNKDLIRILLNISFLTSATNEEAKPVEKKRIDEFIELKLNQIFECGTRNLA